jgi:hypothetical protein
MVQIQFQLLNDKLRIMKNKEIVKKCKLVLVQHNPFFEIDISQYGDKEMEHTTTIDRFF